MNEGRISKREERPVQIQISSLCNNVMMTHDLTLFFKYESVMEPHANRQNDFK